MPDTASVTLVKRFTYRDAEEEWSNTYHFTGPTPSDDAEWKACALAFHGAEKACYGDPSVLVTAYGYEPGTESSVAQIDFTTGAGALPPGTLGVTAGDSGFAGDQASWLRAKIGLSSSGKKVYIRKYYHGGNVSGADRDELSSILKTNLATAATALLAGVGAGPYVWSGPQGQTGTLPVGARYVTTRTLKRRGKRP